MPLPCSYICLYNNILYVFSPLCFARRVWNVYIQVCIELLSYDHGIGTYSDWNCFGDIMIQLIFCYFWLLLSHNPCFCSLFNILMNIEITNYNIVNPFKKIKTFYNIIFKTAKQSKLEHVMHCNEYLYFFQVFPSGTGAITQPLPDPATCRFVRLHPSTYKVHPCLKLELHGCVPWWQRTYFLI